MAINWGMAGQNNNALAYFQMGQQLGQQVIDKRVNEASARYVQGDQNALADVMKYDSAKGAALQRQQQEAAARQQELAAKQREAIRAGAIERARLFDGVSDENVYQQRLALAPRIGMDVSTAPRNFDPRWVEEQKMVLQFVAEKPEALSTFGKIAADEGKRPGTPEHSARVTELVKADAWKQFALVPGAGIGATNPLTNEAKIVVAPYGTTPPPAATTPSEGATATNPQTGAKIIFRNGQWQPMGGQPAGGVPFQQ